MRLAIMLAALCACGSSNKPAPAPKPVAAAATDQAAAEPERVSAGQREVAELAKQNATSEAGLRELAASIQTLDDSEDAVAARRAELQRLQTQREELVKAVTATRTRAQAIADKKMEENGETIKAAEDERARADRSLHELEDVRAKLIGVGERIAKPTEVKSDEPTPEPKKKKR